MGNLLIVLLILFVVAFYFYAIMPRMDKNRRKECMKLASWDYAHRGLWDMEMNIPENSIPAFERAIRQKTAIELDVRLTKDKRLVVAHDNSLKRLCGIPGLVEQKTFRELSTLRLRGTDEGIPLLSQVLHSVRGRVPLLIDIKAENDDTAICSYLARELEFYNGKYMVQSFDPRHLRWFRKNAPHVLIGQLASNYAGMKGQNPFIRIVFFLLLVDGISRPDFISYDVKGIDALSLRIVHSLYKAPVFIWTARNINDYRQARALYSSAIFEKFLP